MSTHRSASLLQYRAAWLMCPAFPYDSDAGRAICGSLSAIMTGVFYAPRPRWPRSWVRSGLQEKNREHMLRVIAITRAAYGEKTGYEKVAQPPVRSTMRLHGAADSAEQLYRAFQVGLGPRHWRSANSMAIATTHPLSLRRPADRPGDGLRHTGIEPDFALVKFKKLPARLLQDHQPRRS